MFINISTKENRFSLLGLKVTYHLDAHSCIAVRSELRRVDGMIGISTIIHV